MAVVGDCNKCGFPVDEGTQVLGIGCNCELEQFNCQPDILFKVMLGEQLLHPGCHGRGAPRRAWKNTDGGPSQPYGSIDSDVIYNVNAFSMISRTSGRKTRSRSPPSLSMESADKVKISRVIDIQE